MPLKVTGLAGEEQRSIINSLITRSAYGKNWRIKSEAKAGMTIIAQCQARLALSGSYNPSVAVSVSGTMYRRRCLKPQKFPEVEVEFANF